LNSTGNSIAIITARGGSKRIPRKNIRLFRGKPIIAYSIEAALKSKLFTAVIVSTDDKEIASIARIHGAEVPFLRDAATADDHSGTADVLLEVIPKLQNRGLEFRYICCMYPTAPFITPEGLTLAYDLMIKNNYHSVFPVCRFGYPIQRALTISADQKIEMIWPENIDMRSQDLKPSYHDAGQFYWMVAKEFMKEKKIFGSNSGAVIIDELHSQDIDTEADWKLAELKHSFLFES
jgi:pseudaminic acid cytidylyltransferase